jgi:hypothetical protein
MAAHDDMGDSANITYEDLKRAADANGMNVEDTIAMIVQTSNEDRSEHPAEYRPTVAAGSR